MLPNDGRFLRIFDSIGSGTSFLLIGGVLGSFLRSREIGHRLLLCTTVTVCGIRAAANFVGAWNLYRHGVYSWDGWMYLLAAVGTCGLGSMIMAARHDLLTTLRTSEMEDRIRADRAADAQMAQWNMEFIATFNRVKSAELAEIQRDGLCHDHTQ